MSDTSNAQELESARLRREVDELRLQVVAATQAQQQTSVDAVEATRVARLTRERDNLRAELERINTEGAPLAPEAPPVPDDGVIPAIEDVRAAEEAGATITTDPITGAQVVMPSADATPAQETSPDAQASAAPSTDATTRRR